MTGAEVQKRYRERHPETIRQRTHDHYWENRDKELARNKEYRRKNGRKISKQRRARYEQMTREEKNETQKRYTAKLKLDVFSHYGGPVCKCCGEDILMLLTIDHIKGGGNKHRMKLGLSARNFYLWLKRNGYPKGFQVLCWSCNRGKWLNGGICPHKGIRRAWLKK